MSNEINNHIEAPGSTSQDSINDSFIAIPADLFPDLMSSNIIEEEDKEMHNAIDTLLELQDIPDPTFEQDVQTVSKALETNEQMQHVIQHMIQVIDQRLQQNKSFMDEAIQLSLAENKFRKMVFKRNKVSKEYDRQFSFFDPEDVLVDQNSTMQNNDMDETEDMDEEDTDEDDEDEDEVKNKADNELNLQQKAWTRYERERLYEGILAEARRKIAFDHVQKNDYGIVWEVDKLPASELESYPVNQLDWKRISNIHVRTRSPTDCLIQWTIQEHPTINKKPWTKNESSRLSELVDEIGLFSGQWERIASELNTNRTIAQCFSHYMYEKNNNAARSLKWTPEEDKRLKDAVKIFGNCNWQQVASIMKGRTGQQCLHRWSKSLNPAIVRRKWVAEEDRCLKRAVQLYGAGNWTKVQRLVPGRTDMQCRERWVNILHPKVDRSKLSKEEEEKLVRLVEEHGRKWSHLATNFFPGRTDNIIMRTFQRLMKEKTTKKKKKIN